MKAIATIAVVVGFLSWCEGQCQTVEYAEIRTATALSGLVNDETGTGIPNVRVIEMSCDWKSQLRSTTPDVQGKWSLYPFASATTYCIEFVKANFDLVCVRVKITKHGNDAVVVKLPVAT